MNDPLSYNRVNPVHRPSLCSSLLSLIWPAQPLPEQSRATAQKRLIFAAALAFPVLQLSAQKHFISLPLQKRRIQKFMLD